MRRTRGGRVSMLWAVFTFCRRMGLGLGGLYPLFTFE